MQIIYGHTTPALYRCLRRVAGVLAGYTVLDAPGDPVLVLGAEGAELSQEMQTRGFVLVPAIGAQPPTPVARAAVRSATVLAVLDESELVQFPDRVDTVPICLTGLPAPPPAEPGFGLDAAAVDPKVRGLLLREVGHVLPDAPGIRWIGGIGSAPIADALEAWAQGRAIVALPGTPRHRVLVRGGVLFASSALHVIEATRFMLGTSALTRTLAARGGAVAASFPSLETVAGRLLEALLLAQTATSPPRNTRGRSTRYADGRSTPSPVLPGGPARGEPSTGCRQ